jgi:hypothetical protein
MFVLSCQNGIAADNDTSAGSPDKITVNRIKIEIGEDLYVWNTGDPVPEKVTGGFTSPSTVMSFVGVKPGDRMSPSSLEMEVYRSEKRLMGSRFFYDAGVSIIPPASDPQKRTVYIRVTEGFIDRFGGGNAYGMYGRDNLSGMRKSFRVYAGYNRAGGEFTDDRLCDSDLIAGGKIYYTRSDRAVKNLIKYQGVDVTVFTGYRLTPGLKIICDARYKLISIGYIRNSLKTEEKDREYRGYNKNEISYRSFIPSFYGTCAYGLDLSEENISSEGIRGIDAHRYHGSGIVLNGTDNLSLNVKVSSGMTGGKIALYDQFNLYSTEDESVRSGYSPRDLFARNFAMVNTEIRFGIYDTMIASIVSLRCTGFLFADIAYLAQERKKMFDDPRKDAYGAGMRILFDSPVFAYFSFSYGFNRDGDGRFVFAGTAGF